MPTPQELLESQVKFLQENNKLLEQANHYLYDQLTFLSGAVQERHEGLEYLRKIVGYLNFFYWLFFLGFSLFVLGSLLKLFFPLVFLALFRF